MSTYPAPLSPVSDDTARRGTDAFLDALDEMDAETQDVIKRLVRALMKHFLENGHPRTEEAAFYQAVAVVAALVWNGKFDSLIVEAVKG